MAPGVRVIVPATPELPLPPAPAGKLTNVPAPTLSFHAGETFVKYDVNAYVSPDASEREIAAIPCDGSCLPGFSFVMRGSDQLVILPRKMSAMTGPVSLRSLPAAGRL